MKKQYKWLIPILILLTIVTGIYFVFFYHDANSLSRWQKHQIITAYKEDYFGIKYFSDDPEEKERYESIWAKSQSLVWYDENGGVEENRVIRYFRTYGDCTVLLVMRDNRNDIGESCPLPFPLRGLSRTVYYPRECDILLYNPKKPLSDMFGNGTTYRIYTLSGMGLFEPDHWLTPEQIDQLTDDLEAWIAKEHPDM